MMNKIWDVLTWKELCLASASSDKTIKYWNLEKFNLVNYEK